MKKLFYLALASFVTISAILPISQSEARNFNQNPVDIVDDVKREANKKLSNDIQNTDLDVVTSKYNECELGLSWRYPIARTLCSIKANIKDYLQYIIYIGLAAATIFIIRNWFKIVTSSNREKELESFKNNLLYIVIWVVLLTGFYYIIDIFVSIVNLIAE